ncbi:uncharacterized protein PHACADRAFT_259113 [Phanerochaete carnosa HHB-10118-sp]|uniref:Uncharacterized protein n=1 Tax=Phanerochaete carnosa (strain HHB-10118-sp) TaxID=650164 RepID=K5WRE5_PHACS|nr:uncharacterized protein PHACADRAFT_259113 [Phanerochaete carnosa HHB-10118-sp]EKM52947.1 hypothetical protein PHACADRAFT_259113 [Phanerochaete carnosa HHB-10118-sp]
MSRSSGMSASAFSMRSQRSSSSSNASVRWDEDCLQGTREAQRRERAQRRSQPGAQESKQSADPRRRTPVIEIFPEIRSTPTMKRSSLEEHAARGNGEQPPVVTLEEATTDYQSEGETSGSATPVKRARPRPWSEQLLEKVRPKAISGDAEGVISILDAATNDLASLINRLDLEATPSSVQGSPLRPLQGSPSLASLGKAGEGSPLKPKRCTFDKTRDAPTLSERESLESISSLRPYGQVGRTHSDPAVPPTRQQAMDTLDVRRMLIGQRIASWNELESQLSSKRPAAQAQATAKPFRPTHRRMVTPGPEDMDIATMFQPLKPSAKQREASVESLPSTASTPAQGSQDPANPSSQTFGSDAPTSKVGKSPSVDLGYDDAAPPSPSPTTRRRPKHSKRSSVLSVMCDTGATLPRESLISLGLTGTLGGPEPEVDPEDPDSDIPDELQAIMSGQSDDDDTTELLGKMLACKRHDRAPSPGLPPSAALPSLQNETKSEQEQKPVFRASLVSVDSNQTDLDESDVSASEDDTKKSFDFTGELRLLNSSGGSDRRSFVEQLESAFRTPGDISLGLQLGANLFLKDVPPTPALQPEHRRTPDKDMVPQSVTEADVSSFRLSLLSDGQSCRDSATSDTLERLLAECEEDICRPYSMLRKSQSTMRSKASDGRLNTSFKFGGKPSIPDSVEESAELKPLTLSDIIPPASHARSPSQSSLMEGDSSVLKSILGNAYEGDTSVVNSIVAQAQAAAPAVPRPRLDSDSSSKRRARESLDLSNMSRSRTNSELSFKGLESFEEVRRGFEFHPNSRPAFYPPPGAPKSWQSRHESMYSIASMSSLGTILDSGISDPFGYASSRPVSTADELSFAMSSTIDDTFSFVRKGSYRKRVDSDASSFCLRPGAARGQRRNESNIPPISIYNRSFGVHRRIDSNSSMSPSNESMESDFSLGSLARPGLGDKMFDRMEYGMPLAAISASPTGSFFSEQDSTSRRYSDISERGEQQGVSYDSVFDTERRASVTDSIFEKTGMPTSHDVSDDVFEFDLSRPTDSPRLNQFRPISMMSVASTTHSIPRSEDTMISMIGGGHVRRRSIDSRIDDSPCIDLERKEKKKHTALQHIARVLEFDQKPDELPSDFVDRLPKISLDKAHATKPSIASTSSFQLGDEPIIKAGKGLLQRQSLEKDALIAHEEKIAASLAATAVFSLPVPVSRSRSSTVTSSGGETPPLSPSDGCSVSSGSQSSIDIAHLDNLLTAATLPASGIARARSARMRERGTGHRRRLSSARISRSSVYETIQEEEYSYSPSPAKPSTNTTVDHNVTTPKDGSLSRAGSIYIVAPDTESVGEWDDEQGIVGVRKYYALRQEADVAVTESKKVWPDTSFSTFAMQTFELPTTRSAMQAMLEQSQKSYGPLSSELRAHRIRSRTSSRTSPYPVRSRRASVEKQPQALPESRPFASPRHSMNMPLVEISINPNTKNAKVFSPQPARDVQPFSKSAVDLESSKHAVARSPSATRRTRVASSARRAALGWSKRNNAKSNTATIKGSAGTGKGPTSSASVKENFGTIRPSTNSALAKENAGTILSHNESLKISRPRPRGRPAPARAALSRAPLAASQSYV